MKTSVNTNYVKQKVGKVKTKSTNSKQSTADITKSHLKNTISLLKQTYFSSQKHTDTLKKKQHWTREFLQTEMDKIVIKLDWNGTAA